jgi:protein TonB
LGAASPESIVAAGPSDAAGPKVVASASGRSLTGAGDQGGGAAGGDPVGVAASLAALGGSDALSGAGASTGSPGYRTNPKPEYPPLAREKGYEGLVLLRVRVLPDGKAGDVLVERSSGHAILDQAALRAVKTWLFAPATRNGIAVSSWVSVPVRFALAS